MARPEKPKTPLGQRLAAARKRLGYKTRPEFALKIGVKADTLGSYERGTAEPDVAFMAEYHSRFDIDLNWLIAGDGDVFGQEGARPAVVRTDLLEEALKLVEEWLTTNARQINRLKKAEVVSQIYSLIAEEIDHSEGSFDIARIHQHLRLVVSR
jgi:transcriptional regulator with XRE-family HTH domain